MLFSCHPPWEQGAQVASVPPARVSKWKTHGADLNLTWSLEPRQIKSSRVQPSSGETQLSLGWPTVPWLRNECLFAYAVRIWCCLSLQKNIIHHQPGPLFSVSQYTEGREDNRNKGKKTPLRNEGKLPFQKLCPAVVAGDGIPAQLAKQGECGVGRQTES